MGCGQGPDCADRRPKRSLFNHGSRNGDWLRPSTSVLGGRKLLRLFDVKKPPYKDSNTYNRDRKLLYHRMTKTLASALETDQTQNTNEEIKMKSA
jgi:hypothetical protein